MGFVGCAEMATGLAGARLHQLEVAAGACKSMDAVVGSSGTRVRGCRLTSVDFLARCVRIAQLLALFLWSEGMDV